MPVTEIIPSSELVGLEAALGDVEQFSLQIVPLREAVKGVPQIKTREEYAMVGGVLSEVRNLRKQGEARFAPFNLIVDRVRSFLRTKSQAHTNACEEVDALCRGKMKQWEHTEAEAAKKEQDALNRKAIKKNEDPVTVQPNIPSVSGYRKSTTFLVEVIDFDALLKKWAGAIGKEKAYLRKFIMVNAAELGREARTVKDPEKLMKMVPGVRAWRE